ncbi:lipopolysaccharide biosynthesis protein [Salimicrobium album]|uniref:Membrane protein involved in the export of O-antigen and teichoic acid n=1 Tax=Salimicrobium album TaxID=50717 RepID=A0A1H3EJJ5_9BACI|nr:oligosaccharide flippase family protein [Salimicrobium album]SDX78942.1 Membrane protein involved in the export of O-antigen and teichoic acid [Salimicrobium album]
MKDTLIKKFLKFSYGSWVGLLLGLLITMITTRLFPPELLGKASMFDLFIQVGMILTIFGADQAFVRFFNEENEEKRGALLFNVLKIPVILTVLTIGLIFLLYAPLTNYLFGRESILLASILSLGVIAQLVFRFGQLVIRMQQKGNLYSLLQIFQKTFSLIFIFVFLYLIGEEFETLVLAKLLTLLFVAVISLYFGRGLWNPFNANVRRMKHSQKDIFKYGAPFVLTIFISWLFEAFDKIALRQWSDFDELGLYTAAFRLVALVMVVRTTFSTFWTPVAYEKFENSPGDKDFFKYISIVITFVMFIVAIASIAAKDIIVLLLGSQYSEAAIIMPFLVFMPIFYTISETTVIGVNFYKKTNWHILIASVACGVNILGNWILVPSYGAIGASIATAFSYVVFFSLRTLFSLKYYRVSYPLKRIYFMFIVVSFYAWASIIEDSFLLNILFGIGPLVILVLIFQKDLHYVLKNRKALFD